MSVNMKKRFNTVAAITAITAFTAISAVAEDIGFDSSPADTEVYEFHRDKPRKMRMDDIAGEHADTPAEKQEFVPINEITITEIVKETPTPDTSAKTKEKKKAGHAFGGRLGGGNMVTLGAGFKIGLTEKERIDASMGYGFFGVGRDGYKASSVEAAGFYEWRFNISDDGALGASVGPGIAFGWYGTSKKIPAVDTIPSYRDKHGDYSIGIGVQFGLEVDLGFIDPGHALYATMKDVSIGVDVRPVYYLPIVKKFPVSVITVGLSFRYKL